MTYYEVYAIDGDAPYMDHPPAFDHAGDAVRVVEALGLSEQDFTIRTIEDADDLDLAVGEAMLMLLDTVEEMHD